MAFGKWYLNVAEEIHSMGNLKLLVADWEALTGSVLNEKSPDTLIIPNHKINLIKPANTMVQGSPDD